MRKGIGVVDHRKRMNNVEIVVLGMIRLMERMALRRGMGKKEGVWMEREVRLECICRYKVRYIRRWRRGLGYHRKGRKR